VGAEGAGEVIDTAISYNRESIERGMLEETKTHVGLVTSSMRITIEACH
jgi:hypothetical protein